MPETRSIRMVRASALKKGATSFTEAQAKARFEAAGLTRIADLRQDDDGIWRGKGSRVGKNVLLGLDYKGNISAD